MGRAQWQANREAGAHVYLALNSDGSPMQVNQFLHQRESNARSLIGARPYSLHPMKPLKQARHFFWRDAGACIAHHEFYLILSLAQQDRDLASKGEFEGIGEEIEDDLLPHLAV